MNSNLTIRPLEAADFKAFLDLQGDALRSAPEVFGSDNDWFDSQSILSKEQRFEKYMLYPYQYLLGAYNAEGSILGMIGFSCAHDQSKLRHKGKVWGLFVKPEFRGAGIASALIKSVLHTAEEIGCEQILLAVSTSNKDSYSLYLRLGFTVYGTEPRALRLQQSYVDEYLMVLFLR